MLSSSFFIRKIITASLSSSLYTILFSLFYAYDYGIKNVYSTSGFWLQFITWVPIHLMFIFPTILIYGASTSIISDLISHYFFRKGQIVKSMEFTISAMLHVLFGMILLWISLFAAILFFITDRLLSKKDHYSWHDVLRSLIVPVVLWLACMCVVWIRG